MSVIRKTELRAIFDGIDKDYEKFNNLPEIYHPIIHDTISKTKLLEKTWFIVMVVTASSYPVVAGIFTVYSQLFSENPKRYMIHEMTVMLLTEEQKYESPIFELFALYSTYIVWVIFVGFAGYEGMFTVCALHVSLKIKLFNKNLEHFMDNVLNTEQIKGGIEVIVEEHCEAIRLTGEIQKCYEIWLVGIFFNAVLQIGMTLTQVTFKGETAMYYLFALATAVHIYLPCYIISDITYNFAEVAKVAYNCSWERIQDASVRRCICIIINKAQKPVHLKALNILTFNMEMFLSIMQTAYSMFTLLRS